MTSTADYMIKFPRPPIVNPDAMNSLALFLRLITSAYQCLPFWSRRI